MILDPASTDSSRPLPPPLVKPDWQICSSDDFGTNFFGVNITGGVLILSIPGIVKFDEKLVAAADADDVDVDAVLSV